MKVLRAWAIRMQIRYEDTGKGPYVTLPGCEVMKEVDEPDNYAWVRLRNGHKVRVPYGVIINGKRGIDYE